jgi:hypothetical protein
MQAGQLSRRQLLLGACALVGASVGVMVVSTDTVTPTAASTVTPQPQNLLIGVVESVSASNRRMDVRTRTGRSSVTFTSNAIYARGADRRVSGVGAFQAGDEVVVERLGARVGDAVTVRSLYHLDEGRIVHRQGARLDTNAGVIVLAPSGRAVPGPRESAAKPLESLVAGDEISATTWRDPSSGDHVAVRVSTHKT